MPAGGAATPLIGALGLLERAIGYTRGSLQLVTPDCLPHPTPCQDWDLDELLHHMDDSLAALQEAADIGYVDLQPPGSSPTGDIVGRLRARACALLGAWAGSDGTAPVSVGGSPLETDMLACAGALEILVHGWDVARACAAHRPLPSPLAEELQELVPLLVTDRDRPIRFAAALDVPPLSCAGDRLLAALGRRP